MAKNGGTRCEEGIVLAKDDPERAQWTGAVIAGRE